MVSVEELRLMEDMPNDSFPKTATLIQCAGVPWTVHFAGCGHEVGPALQTEQEFIYNDTSPPLTAMIGRDLYPVQISLTDRWVQLCDAGSYDLTGRFIHDCQPEVG